ncbi:MAG: GNAT family N-acetyltransferase [Candidatus Hodarchaeota archaeon]
MTDLVHIRAFLPSDRASLIEISKHTWGGYDQLPYELDDLIENPASYLFVMEFKNRIVAFANLNLIDNGKTAWMEHMRVHWRYRKRGFAWTMTQRLISEAEALGVKRLRLATTVENEATRRITMRIGMRPILQMKIFWKGKFRGIRWKDVSVPIVSCTPQEAYAFLEAHSVLVPEGIITYNWHAFDFTKELFKSMGERFRFWKGGENCTRASLSFGYLGSIRDTLVWISTIYASDSKSFYSALSHQLETAKRELAQEFLCFHSRQFQAAQEIPGLKQRTFSSQLVLYEKHRPFRNPSKC